MIEGSQDADDPAGERGADCKELTGTLKNYLFVFFSSDVVKLGFHGSKRKCESIKTFFSFCSYTLYVNAFPVRIQGSKKTFGLSFGLAVVTFFLLRATACVS